MLIGISPLISPDILAVPDRMGHGDEIVLADAHSPGETHGGRVLRAEGLRIEDFWMQCCPFLPRIPMSTARYS